MSENKSIIVDGKSVSEEEFRQLKQDKTLRLKLREDASDGATENYKTLKRDDKL